ncbi:hypothetical protein Tco_0281303 [Tanacetum coccineum]
MTHRRKVIHDLHQTPDSERTKSETEAAAPKGDKDQDEVDTSIVTLGSSDSNVNSSSDCSLHRCLIFKSRRHCHIEQNPPPINTEATTLTISLPEITPFIALQLRVARLEQEISEVKKTDHSADVLASIRSQVPTAVDNYLGTKLDDALLKVLERHTTDLIEKYSVLPGPESVKNQESEKSPKEIIKAKKEQGEEKQDSTYSIRSTDKNKMPCDKEVSDKLKTTKEKHDSDELIKMMKKLKAFKLDQTRVGQQREGDLILPLLGQLNLLRKMMTKVQRKPRESEASASKQHPTLSSTGWQITDTREAGVDSSMHRSDPESEHSEQSSDDISKQDEGNDSDMEDTDNAHIPKVSTTTWFKPIPESERPATPEPEWTIPPNDFPEPEHNWQKWHNANKHVKVHEKTSFKGRRMILGRSSNGSADEQERRSSAKLI